MSHAQARALGEKPYLFSLENKVLGIKNCIGLHREIFSRDQILLCFFS